MLRSLILALVLFTTPAYAVYTISTPDGGGSVSTYMDTWKQVALSGEKVVIDAPCISACSFFLGLVPLDRVCLTSRASIGVHQVSDQDGPDPVFSAAFYRWLYPDWFQQMIKDQGGLKADVIFFYPEDLKGHVALCPGYQYDSVTPDQLINHAKNDQ